MKIENKNKDLTEEIKDIIEFLNNIKSATNVEESIKAIDRIVNSFSTILSENNEEIPRRNLYIGINKYNYEKYLHLKNELDNIVIDIEKLKKENFITDKGSTFISIKLSIIKEHICKMQNRVIYLLSNYQNSQKNIKKNT